MPNWLTNSEQLDFQGFSLLKWEGKYELNEINEHTFSCQIGGFKMKLVANEVIVQQVEEQKFIVDIHKLQTFELIKDTHEKSN